MEKKLTERKWKVAGRDGITWEFVKYSMFFSEEGFLLGGMLCEWDGERLIDLTEYCYHSVEDKLTIDRQAIDPGGEKIRHEEHFRIEVLNEQTLKLHAWQP